MEKFTLGDTIRKEFPMTETEGLTAVMFLKHLCNTLTVPLSESEGTFTALINPADQSTLSAGIYQYFVRVTETATGEVKTVADGSIILTPDPSESCDQRTQFEKDLEAVDDAMRGIVKDGASRYRIHMPTGGERELEKLSLEELKAHRLFLVRQVNKERVALGKKPIGGDVYKTFAPKMGGGSCSYGRGRTRHGRRRGY